MDPDDADRRIAAQADMWDRVRETLGAAYRRVDTSGSPAEAEARVAELWARLAAGSEAAGRLTGQDQVLRP
jgi:hypothetical protein